MLRIFSLSMTIPLLQFMINFSLYPISFIALRKVHAVSKPERTCWWRAESTCWRPASAALTVPWRSCLCRQLPRVAQGETLPAAGMSGTHTAHYPQWALSAWRTATYPQESQTKWVLKWQKSLEILLVVRLKMYFDFNTIKHDKQFDHSPYTSDLAPSDLHIFVHLKFYLVVQKLNNNEKLKEHITTMSKHSQQCSFKTYKNVYHDLKDAYQMVVVD